MNAVVLDGRVTAVDRRWHPAADYEVILLVEPEDHTHREYPLACVARLGSGAYRSAVWIADLGTAYRAANPVTVTCVGPLVRRVAGSGEVLETVIMLRELTVTSGKEAVRWLSAIG